MSNVNLERTVLPGEGGGGVKAGREEEEEEG